MILYFKIIEHTIGHFKLQYLLSSYKKVSLSYLFECGLPASNIYRPYKCNENMYMPESLSCNLIFTITNLKAIQKNHYIFNMTAHNDIAVYI